MLSTHRDERVNNVFLRAIGALAIADHELRQQRAGAPAEDSWTEFADHLTASATAVLEGAAGSSFPGNTISILRDGVHVAVDEGFIDKLTDKMEHHIRVGKAHGLLDDAAEPVSA